MQYSFPKYLLSKRTVDDRALNQDVYARLRQVLPEERPVKIIEIGAGIGTMPARLIEWGLLDRVDYTAIDASPENIANAREWLPHWAQEHGLAVEAPGESLRLYGERRDVQLRMVASDVFDFIQTQPPPASLLIAHAVLDLLPLPGSLPQLLSLVERGGLAWLTLNFDGATLFEPEIDPVFDDQVTALYHRTMDERVVGGQPSGDSRTGRHLFTYLRQAGAEILAAGASDWVVFPRPGGYPPGEANFLHFILRFFESALGGHTALDQERFADWLAARRAQIERGELVYIAHQLDFLVRVRNSSPTP
jgi:SAM-dependent methyltransferase